MSRELRKENDVKLKKHMMFAITVFLPVSYTHLTLTTN